MPFFMRLDLNRSVTVSAHESAKAWHDIPAIGPSGGAVGDIRQTDVAKDSGVVGRSQGLLLMLSLGVGCPGSNSFHHHTEQQEGVTAPRRHLALPAHTQQHRNPRGREFVRPSMGP